jgi:hypothetical protein
MCKCLLRELPRYETNSQKERLMTDKWEKNLACAVVCSRCNANMAASDQRILSVYDHQPICMACKKREETRPDYEKISKEMIGACMAETEVMYGDPGGYCFYHFYPFRCQS